eukprot:1536078-Pyramimonas_sp.AAC.1
METGPVANPRPLDPCSRSPDSRPPAPRRSQETSERPPRGLREASQETARGLSEASCPRPGHGGRLDRQHIFPTEAGFWSKS